MYLKLLLASSKKLLTRDVYLDPRSYNTVSEEEVAMVLHPRQSIGYEKVWGRKKDLTNL